MKYPAFSPSFYNFMAFFIKPLFRLLFGVKTFNIDLVPEDDPVIICANHTSYMDPIILGVAIPRCICFMMLKRYYDMKWIGFLSSLMGSFPVSPGSVDLQALRTSRKLLKEGGALGIFPEGGRSVDGRLKDGMPGAVLISLREKVPIIPAGIRGTFKAYPPSRRFPRRHPVTVHFGEPLAFYRRYDYRKDKQKIPEMTRELMAAIGRLAEKEG